MDNTNEINRKIADNLIRFRKAAGYTQAELAEKINYSDKSVSKWESGNGIPDVYTLIQLSKLYGVTLDSFIGDETPIKVEKKTGGLRILIMLLSSGIVWLVATCLFVALQLSIPAAGAWWLIFLYAAMANAIVLIVFSGIWRYRMLNFFSVSALVWIALTCIYTTLNLVFASQGKEADGLWMLFIIGAPLQALEILWVFFRSLFQKFHRETEKSKLKKKRKIEKAKQKAEKKAEKEVKKDAKKAKKKAMKEAKTAEKIAAKYKKEVEKANK